MAAAATRAQQTTHLQALADALLADLRSGTVAGIPRLPNLPPVRVRLSARLTSSAGMYYAASADIAISTHFLATHGMDGIDGVIRHEVAHHAVRHHHGRAARPHGREFAAVAAALGASMKAAAFAAPRTVHLYRCPGCGWEWQRGRRVRRGRRFACARCAPHYDDRFRLVYRGSRRIAPAGMRVGP